MEISGDLTAKLSRESSLENIPSLEDGEINNLSEKPHFMCGICNEKFVSPKVLHCLHVFCTKCLEKSLEESGPTQIICQTCKQVTRLTTAGAVNELPVDAVIVNLMEMEAISSLMVVCTSCKAQENAVARCSDCSNFLCPNCVTAHNYMRCFENHKVETFDELKNGKGIHKPMHCSVHPSEPFKFYCKTCQVLTCTECMVYLHKLPDHQCERVVDMEQKQRDGLRQIISDAKTKISTFEETNGKLETLLSELQQQRDNVQDLINETFQSYKASLERRKDELLKELDDIHSKKELAIMEMFHSLETIGEKMDDACIFTERVVENADAVEMLSLSKVIRAQMKTLHEDVPNSDLSIKIEVESDAEKFAEATKMYFCAFKKANNSGSTSSSACPLSSKTSPFDGQLGGVLQHSSAFDNDRFKLLEPATVAALTSGLNLPAELMNSLTASLAPPLLNDLASNIATSLAVGGNGLSGLGQTLNFAERSLSRNSYSPTISDSGVSVDVSSTSNQQTLMQLQQLIKHGQIGLNAQGQITVSGHVIPGFQGLNWNMMNSTSMSQNVVSNQVGRNGGAGVSESALASLLNSVSMSSNPLGGTTPNLNELSALFNNLSTHQSLNLGGIQSTSPITASVTSNNLLSGPPPNLPLNGVFPVQPAGASYSVPPPAGMRTRSGKTNSMEIRTKFGQLGPGKGQFNAPHGFCLGMDEDIVVADTNNHRIQVFEKNGEFKYQFGIPGRDEGQLWYPRKVAVIRTSGRYVVCDRGSERSRMQLFTRNGQFIKKIAIRYIDIVAGLAITSQGHIVAVDSVSPTVFCISESGELIKWFDCSDYMREPSDIAVSGKDYYVCDFKGHCVVVFNEDGQFLHRIGCDIITNYPNGIDISDAGDVLIGDSHGNRFHVAVFQRDGSLIGEFECPYVKVSRCCGLKITSEGYIVTLAKNNQHVLVLNTLYIA